MGGHISCGEKSVRRRVIAGTYYERRREAVSRTDPGFDNLYERYHRPILAYCLRRTSRADAHEAANETFTVAWRRYADLPPVDEALPWL
jgi:DNA-directed RNA polymerase specialized sigma24 family protein